METRDAKHEPRSLAEQRATWHAQAAAALGGPDAVQAMVQPALSPRRRAAPDRGRASGWRRRPIGCWRRWRNSRSTWQSWHVRAEAQRHVRAADVPTDQVEQLVELLVDEVLRPRSVALTRTGRRHQRAGGVASGRRFERLHGCRIRAVHLARILAAEQRLVATAGRTDGRVVDAATVELALLEWPPTGTPWMPGRPLWFVHVHLRGAAAAGDRPGRRREDHRHARPGRAWREAAARCIGLAPSAAAAAAAPRATGIRTDTLAKLTWSIHHDDLPDWAARDRPVHAW